MYGYNGYRSKYNGYKTPVQPVNRTEKVLKARQMYWNMPVRAPSTNTNTTSNTTSNNTNSSNNMNLNNMNVNTKKRNENAKKMYDYLSGHYVRPSARNANTGMYNTNMPQANNYKPKEKTNKQKLDNLKKSMKKNVEQLNLNANIVQGLILRINNIGLLSQGRHPPIRPVGGPKRTKNQQFRKAQHLLHPNKINRKVNALNIKDREWLRRIKDNMTQISASITKLPNY